MMRVLYGVQGTGNGHLARSRVVLSELVKRGACIDVLMSGRPATAVPQLPAAQRVVHRHGLSFVARAGKVDLIGTAKALSPFQFLKDVRALEIDSYDRIITDYEPVVAWAGRRANARVIGVGHQYAFGANTPQAGGDFFSRAILRHFAPASVSLGLHWRPYSSTVLPPIVDTNLLHRTACHDAVVVYLPWESQAEVISVLRCLSPIRFHLYCAVPAVEQRENVCLCPISHAAFKQDLSGAAAVICNAGFELISEAIYLGIPVLAKALAGQMEQLSNARALQQSNLAAVTEVIDVDALGQWLSHTPTAVQHRYPNVAGAVAEWVVSGADAADVAGLASSLWEQVEPLTSPRDVGVN